MKQSLFRNLFLVIVALLISQVIYAQEDLSDKLDKLVREYNEMQLFSGSVLVIKNDTILFKKAVGNTDYENEITPITTETVFNIGSIQKTFTKELIKMLADEGKLNYNDKLGKYVTGFSDKRAEDATIEQLLTMQAGFGDFVMLNEIRQNEAKYTSIDDFLEIIKKESLLFEPGSRREYSNSGYVILGGVIEKVTGKSYEEFLNERILIPLKMTSSYYKKGNEITGNKANGHVVSPDGTIFQPRGFNLAPTPAGSMYSNLDDLLKFGNYLMEKSQAQLREIHAGGLPGWNSIMGLLEDKGFTIIILSNFDEPSAEALFDQVLNVLNNKRYDPPKLPIGRFIYNEILKSGVENFSTNYNTILKENGYELENDLILNRLGYDLLNKEKPDESIAIFKLNVKLFPNIANCYDSLGEAYMISGKTSEAIENYEKALAMDPGNKNALEKLNQLRNNK